MAVGSHIGASMTPTLMKRGCVNVIGLDVIKSSIGDARWQKSSEHIYGRLEALLRAKLGPTDYFVRLTDESYLVATPSFNESDAALCCLKVAHDLHTSLLGTCSITELSLSRPAGDKPGEQLLTRLDGDALSELAVKAGIVAGAAPSERPVAESSAAKGPVEVKRPAARFAPVWDLRRDIITSFRLNLAPPQSPEQALAADFRVMVARVTDGLRQAANVIAARQGRFLVIVPVHFEVLSAPIGRMEITSVCRSLPADVRPLLMFEIFDVPPGVPRGRMSELVSALRPFCRGCSVSFTTGFFEYPDYTTAGLQAIGISTPYGTPPRLLRDQLGKLTKAAARQSIATFLSEVRSLDSADIGRVAGINIMLGPAVGPEVDAPTGMAQLNWAGFLQNNARAERVGRTFSALSSPAARSTPSSRRAAL